MVRHSVIAFERWGSRRLLPRRDHRGRTRTLSVSSVRSAENVWITSSSSMSAICAAFSRAIFNTIMTSERIFRSARTARGLVPYNLPRPAISLPSRKLAVCTITMSVEPPKSKDWTFLLVPRQTAITLILSKQGQALVNSLRSGLAPQPVPLSTMVWVPPAGLPGRFAASRAGYRSLYPAERGRTSLRRCHRSPDQVGWT